MLFRVICRELGEITGAGSFGEEDPHTYQSHGFHMLFGAGFEYTYGTLTHKIIYVPYDAVVGSHGSLYVYHANGRPMKRSFSLYIRTSSSRNLRY